jgi:hypothetical protein
MEVSLPWIQIIIMTILSWVGGALWFGPLFGKMWMKIRDEIQINYERNI